MGESEAWGWRKHDLLRKQGGCGGLWWAMGCEDVLKDLQIINSITEKEPLINVLAFLLHKQYYNKSLLCTGHCPKFYAIKIVLALMELTFQYSDR